MKIGLDLNNFMNQLILCDTEPGLFRNCQNPMPPPCQDPMSGTAQTLWVNWPSSALLYQGILLESSIIALNPHIFFSDFFLCTEHTGLPINGSVFHQKSLP